MDKDCCLEKCVLGCVIFLVASFVMGPVILGVYGVPGLMRVIAEDKHGSFGSCMVTAHGFNDKIRNKWFWFLPTCHINATYFLVRFSLKTRTSSWKNVTLVKTFEEAYSTNHPQPYSFLNVSKSQLFGNLIPSLNGFTPILNKSTSCFKEQFPCNYLKNKPYVVYLEPGSQTEPIVLFSVGLALSVLGGFPIIVVCFMIGGDHLSIKHMMWKSRKREKKVKDTMESLGSGNNQEQWKALRSMDIHTEYFHGRYHRANLFDIAAHSGNIEALEFLYTLPQVTIDGVLPKPQERDKKKDTKQKRQSHYYESFPEQKLPERRRTPLHHACIGHQLQSIKFFVSHGANVNLQDHDGDTPLLAVLKEAVRIHQDFDNMHEILSVLVEAGTNMRLCGRFTPLYSACTIGDSRLIHYMLQCGSRSTKMVKNFARDTPLTTMMKQNNLTGIKLVLHGGYRLKKDSLFKGRIEPDTAIGAYLLGELETVTPLTRLARNLIRIKLGSVNVRKKLMTLPLPSMLLDYVDLIDLLDLIPENDTGTRFGDDEFIAMQAANA